MYGNVNEFSFLKLGVLESFGFRESDSFESEQSFELKTILGCHLSHPQNITL